MRNRGESESNRRGTGRMVRWPVQVVTHAIPGARVLLAFKTALAVSLAWVVALQMPGVIDDYPYYAPLGALSAMYPTILGSVRTGLQTVAGLALGILLAAGVLALGEPNLVSIGLAVGIGVLVSGLGRLGAGAEYVPMAALFVLIIGGQDAGAYSVGYLIQMAVGVVIGLLVNVVVFPPLDFRTARLQLDRLQGVVVDYLEDIADELTAPETTDGRDWDRRSRDLFRLTGQVREAVDESARSARGNPRAARARRHRDMDPGYGSLKKLERVTFHLLDLTDVLRLLYDGPQHEWAFSTSVADGLAQATRGSAACVQAWADDESPAEAADNVREILGRLYSTLGDSSAGSQASRRLVVAVAEDLQRLVDVLDPPPPRRVGSTRAAGKN